ncbi:MAG TPA: hypothetical protein VMZ50_09555, partial [Phycisphaerae bacterium]|nr:hypothetical protein [Phycisphaerae bacterium]
MLETIVKCLIMVCAGVGAYHLWLGVCVVLSSRVFWRMFGFLLVFPAFGCLFLALHLGGNSGLARGWVLAFCAMLLVW